MALANTISRRANQMACERTKEKSRPHIVQQLADPNVQKDWFDAIPEYDFVCTGEGEKAIVWILNNWKMIYGTAIPLSPYNKNLNA